MRHVQHMSYAMKMKKMSIFSCELISNIKFSRGLLISPNTIHPRLASINVCSGLGLDHSILFFRAVGLEQEPIMHVISVVNHYYPHMKWSIEILKGLNTIYWDIMILIFTKEFIRRSCIFQHICNISQDCHICTGQFGLNQRSCMT